MAVTFLLGRKGSQEVAEKCYSPLLMLSFPVAVSMEVPPL